MSYSSDFEEFLGMLPVRLANALQNSGIRSLGDLRKKTESDLLEMDGVGARSIKWIVGGLSAKGMALRGGMPDPGSARAIEGERASLRLRRVHSLAVRGTPFDDLRLVFERAVLGDPPKSIGDRVGISAGTTSAILGGRSRQRVVREFLGDFPPAAAFIARWDRISKFRQRSRKRGSNARSQQELQEIERMFARDVSAAREWVLERRKLPKSAKGTDGSGRRVMPAAHAAHGELKRAMDFIVATAEAWDALCGDKPDLSKWRLDVEDEDSEASFCRDRGQDAGVGLALVLECPFKEGGDYVKACWGASFDFVGLSDGPRYVEAEEIGELVDDLEVFAARARFLAGLRPVVVKQARAVDLAWRVIGMWSAGGDRFANLELARKSVDDPELIGNVARWYKDSRLVEEHGPWPAPEAVR